jgi:hypothetical protein
MRLLGTMASGIANVGSKSERIAYRIVQPNGQQTRIYKSGDNPFINASLVPFDGQEVELFGEFDGDVFIISDIHKLNEPARSR